MIPLRLYIVPIQKLHQLKLFNRNYVSYTQGQHTADNVRQYFYYVNHEGMLFLDDARIKNFTSCFKEQSFLRFFFKNLRKNKTSMYPDFPYISLCQKEINYLRCDDLPIVFTKIFQDKTDEKKYWIGYGHAENKLKVPFEPDKLFMNIFSGRLYHPAISTVDKIGLVRSKLAIEISKHFIFEKGEESSPTHFKWDNEVHVLDTEWYKNTIIWTKSYK